MVRWRTNDVQNGVVRVDAKQLSSLIRQEPISKYYNVQQPPFAEGAFASVYRAQQLATGTWFAAKVCRRHRSGLDSTAEIHHEIALLSLCSASPRIVRLHDVFQTHEHFVIVMEYAPGGDMQTIIDNNIVPYEADVVRFVQHVVEGLSYLHHRRIAHLDIKPQNLVLMGDFPHCDVKVCDFEISRVILDGSDIHEILGTPEYVAPEILHYEPITLAADMWSLGVTVYVLLTGFSPFGGETDQETFLNISRAQLDFPDELFDDVSEHAKDFIAKLLKRNPKDRMTAKQCLRHPWLANNKPHRRYRQSKTTTHPATNAAAAAATSSLRKYLSKSREALFERVVARHQQMSPATGSRSRYDRTRRLCESQMSLVSRSREQLLLTGNKRCLSRDKLYGIRHLSKSHEVLNSLAGALEQLDDDDKVTTATNQQTTSGDDVTTRSPADTSPLHTVLTLLRDTKNNNNDEKEQTKENGSSGTSATNQTKPTPTTPDSDSKVLSAIEKLQLAINEKNNNRNKDNNKTQLDENRSTKTADQRKISLTTADDNKTQTPIKTADQNRNSSLTTMADQNKTFATPKTADHNRNTSSTHCKRFTVSKTADHNRFSSYSDANKTSNSSTNTDQTKLTSPTKLLHLENNPNFIADHSNKSNSSNQTRVSSLSCSTAEHHSKNNSKTADLNRTASCSSTTADRDKYSKTADLTKVASGDKSAADQPSSSTQADQDKCSKPADNPKITDQQPLRDKSADQFPKTGDNSDQSKMAVVDVTSSLKFADKSAVDQSKMATAADVTSSSQQKRPSRLLLIRQTLSQSADPSSPQGGTSLSPTTDPNLSSSEEADVSELDSSSQQSTWQRNVEEDEPRFTVAQLVTAFNKHQALVTKTSLEVTMNMRGGAPEAKILPEEVGNHTINRKFPIGPDALRLFIPGIKFNEHNLKKSPSTTPSPLDSLEKTLLTKSSNDPTKKSPTTPPVSENSSKSSEIEPITVEKQRKISSTADKSVKPTVDCSAANIADFSPPTPPPPPPAPSSGETKNYKDFGTARTTRHRTSGRQATTLAASSKIRKKSNTTPKPPPFY
ncbi:hypothetical protein LSTR_LSTR015468 [Laodelphax striatellus]|uniref:Protein kinase domain-containing protein n=1 Tax=Laodelphax striatellus TaxID=195883 RepID=A0A482XTB2_LAOST|nr:hypothetical protein LSTR_LSTR015468 [Laodelphax striatellus]